MQSTSRQVLKKRRGVTIPVHDLKSRIFAPNLYLDAELKKLDMVLDENDVNLNGTLNLILWFEAKLFLVITE